MFEFVINTATTYDYKKSTWTFEQVHQPQVFKLIRFKKTLAQQKGRTNSIWESKRAGLP
jgi:predicted kinase